jgi:signal transduction histidine kinase
VLPDVKQHEKRIVYSSVPKEIVLPWQIRGEKIAFRIRTFGVPYDGRQFTVQIARPITKLEEEIREVVLMLVGGLAASCVVLVLLSRLLAAKILKPIGTMKEMTREIGAQNLDKRLPVAPENDEINDLAETINWMLDRLQKSFARQRNFLFDSSHELKTPLTTMRLALGQILESDAGSASEPTRENLLQLRAQVLRMDRLVKDLLNLSALETMTQIDPKPVDLPKILESLADDYQLLADARRIRIDTDVPELAQIQGDGEKLSRAFSNLLDNAIKYNRDGGDVKMTGAESDGEIRISISNTGPGIPDAEIDKVFGQFYRVESSRSSRHGGSGLGLAIVKRTIELHGGNVRIHSDPDGLTTVTVTLPERG